MAFNVGERVEYAYNEPSADYDEMHGKVIEVIAKYRIEWDDGTTDVHGEDDLRVEET